MNKWQPIRSFMAGPCLIHNFFIGYMIMIYKVDFCGKMQTSGGCQTSISLHLLLRAVRLLEGTREHRSMQTFAKPV